MLPPDLFSAVSAPPQQPEFQSTDLDDFFSTIFAPASPNPPAWTTNAISDSLAIDTLRANIHISFVRFELNSLRAKIDSFVQLLIRIVSIFMHVCNNG